VPKSNSSIRFTPGSSRAVLAANIVRLRSKLGWSQEALALQAGFHRTFVTHVEGQTRNIGLDNIEKLAHALSVPTYILLMPTE
jgi:transcriptional regulator with XRE-family HTH domain